MVTPIRLSVPASDGYSLSASLFEPAGRPIGFVVISSGAAIPQRIFARFAAYCAERGLAAITYDYRGIAASAPADLRDFPARMRDWALLDLSGIIAWAKRYHGDLPLLYAGHSFGGHAFGLNPQNTAFRRALLVATMSGYWGHFPLREGLRVYALMNLVAPPVLASVGYMPGSLGLGEAMSAGVFREWAAWCRLKGYFFDDPSLPETRNFAGYRGPIRSIAMEDDPWTPPRAVEGLMRHFTNAHVEYVRHAPHALGAEQIGHTGFFRPGFRELLWRENVDWLVSGLSEGRT